MSFSLATIISPSPVLVRTRLGMLAQASARQIYVNPAGSDLNPGTSTSPLKTISKAYSVATPGDSILLNGSFAESVTPAISGLAGSPISVMSTPGSLASWRGSVSDPGSLVGGLNINGRSYLSVKGIKFTGNRSRSAIRITDASNLEISGCSFIDNGNNGIASLGEKSSTVYPSRMANSFISGNMFDSNYGSDIWLIESSGNRIIDNTMTRLRGSMASDNGGAFLARAIHIGGGSKLNRIERNNIYNFTKDPSVNTYFAACGVRLDSGGTDNIVIDNVIHDLDYADAGRSNGIYPEAGCNNNLFQRNKIYNIGEEGIRDGSTNMTAPSGNRFLDNLIYACRGGGILLWNSRNSIIRGNNISMNGKFQIYAATQSVANGGHIFESNNYWNGSSPLIAYWNGPASPTLPANLTLAQWAAKSGDRNSTNVDPGTGLPPPPPPPTDVTVGQNQNQTTQPPQNQQQGSQQPQPKNYSSVVVPVAIAGAVALLLLTLGD